MKTLIVLTMAFAIGFIAGDVQAHNEPLMELHEQEKKSCTYKSLLTDRLWEFPESWIDEDGFCLMYLYKEHFDQ